MGPLPLSVCISVYIWRVCVWYNVVGKDPRWDHYHILCALVCISVVYVRVWCNVVGKDPRWDHYHFLCALVCISVAYVCCIML
jgi:cytochrome c oxidase assembly factor CtaG